MKNIKDFKEEDLKDHRNKRLLKEWKELDAFCSARKAKSPNPLEPSISYIIRKRNYMELPVEYEIWYRVRSIIGVKDGPAPREPIFGNLHKMRIVLPNNYPSADGNPVFTFLTDVWHPNIRYSGEGDMKGHVCLNSKAMGVRSTLAELVYRVERYLKYNQYHAENTDPYPEDQIVAQWVREEGEPNGWTQFRQNDNGESGPAAPPIEPTPTPAPMEPEPITPKKKYRI